MKSPRLPGLTLVELLISMVILLPFLGIVVWMTSEISSAQLQTVNYDSATRETQYASLVIAKDLDDATAITQPTNEGPANQLRLITPAGTISYSLSNGRLTRTDAQGGAFLLSQRSTVTGFTATRAGDGLQLVTVTLTVQAASNIGGGDPAVITRTISRQLK